ncbi:MAG: hypothetical protein M3Y04_07180, partial [Actinomycetota bacterium]|nr:hypothetical protein [Actinomycetota bacterium]
MTVERRFPSWARRYRLLAAAVAVVVAAGGALVIVTRRSRGGTASEAGAEVGAWQALQAPPLAPRISSAVVWTGRQLVVWGGRSCVGGRCDDRSALSFADGAAFDARAGSWRAIAPGPLSPRSGAVAVWSGREVLVWGGTDEVPLSDGAAYDPVADRWRSLSPGPLVGDAQAVWSGAKMLVWAG